jgi:hypothetical protein
LGVTVRGGRAAVGFNYDSQQGLNPSGGVVLAQATAGSGGGQIGISTKGGTISGTLSVRIPETPFSVGVSTNGTQVTGIQAGIGLGKYATAQINGTVGSFYQCK